MIARIRGVVAEVVVGGVIIDVQGVGYFIHTTAETVESLRLELGEVILHTHFAVRETAQDLYGFRTHTELALFELLLTVSGIGPKSALSILNIAGVEALRAAVSANDISYLTKVSGIGRKNAEKIVLELRDKLPAATGETIFATDTEVIEALGALGYSQKEVREVLKLVPREVTGTNARLKEALTRLGKA